MIDRPAVIDAVAAEVERLHVPDPRAVGGRVADRLGLGAPIEHAPVADPLDALGVGIFVRKIHDFPIELVARFGWVCVALLNSGRMSLNRDSGWFADARAAGVRITVFDWLPPRARWLAGLTDGVRFADEVGALAWIGDCEGDWHGAPESAAIAYMDSVTEFGGGRVRPGFTSLALPSLHRTIPWRAFLSRSALAIPQPYDADSELDPAYPQRSCDEYRAHGAVRNACGRGAYRRDDPHTPRDEAGWRSASEIAEQRALTPTSGLVGTCWWPPAGRPDARLVDAMVG
jgi:hypothetical protein